LNFFSLFKRHLIYKLKNKKNLDHDSFSKKTLDELFEYYGSDKANFFKKGNREGHGYSKFYTSKLNHLKNHQINILEIGSYAGASAAAFVKYFPNANVFCFDVNISNFEFKSQKIHVFGIDINNKNKVKKTIIQIFKKLQIPSFDLIIDDGSHNLGDILTSLNLFFKFLKEDGAFIIEDFKHPNYYEYNRNINHILVNEFLNNILDRKLSTSSIFSDKEQYYLMNTIKKIDFCKGNLKDSDICFIRKKIN
jgi:predicted O-methyltransferase YrrM